VGVRNSSFCALRSMPRDHLLPTFPPLFPWPLHLLATLLPAPAQLLLRGQAFQGDQLHPFYSCRDTRESRQPMPKRLRCPLDLPVHHTASRCSTIRVRTRRNSPLLKEWLQRFRAYCRCIADIPALQEKRPSVCARAIKSPSARARASKRSRVSRQARPTNKPPDSFSYNRFHRFQTLASGAPHQQAT